MCYVKKILGTISSADVKRLTANLTGGRGYKDYMCLVLYRINLRENLTLIR